MAAWDGNGRLSVASTAEQFFPRMDALHPSILRLWPDIREKRDARMATMPVASILKDELRSPPHGVQARHAG
jgi:hypothetical protein